MSRDEIQLMLDAQTKAIFERMDKTDATLKPITAVYDQAKSFGVVSKFLFKTFFIPFTIIMGFILTLKELLTHNIWLK